MPRMKTPSPRPYSISRFSLLAGFTGGVLALVVGCSEEGGGLPASSGGGPGVDGNGGALTSSGGASSGAGGALSSVGGAVPSAGGAETEGTGGTETEGTGGADGTGGTEGNGTGGSDGGGGTGGSDGTDVERSAGCSKAPTFSGESTHTIQVGGAERTYIVRVPDNYDRENPYRLYVASHPLNGTAAGVARGGNGTNYQYYGLWSRDDDNTIFLSPQGNGNGWFNPQGGDENFIMAVIEKLENEMCIDSSRIFAGGFSMGGAMSYALACRFPEKFRAAIMHSGGAMSGCNQSNRGPVAFFITHGTNDRVCTYPQYGVPQLNDFATRNGCDPLQLPTPTDASGRTPVCVDFQNCDAGYPTRACIFVGDHTPSPGGEANTWVADETWDFISQF